MNAISGKPEKDPRDHPRYPVDIVATLRCPGRSFPITVTNLSAAGAKLKLDAANQSAFEGPGWYLDLGGLGTHPLRREWRLWTEFGVSFNINAAEQGQLAAKLNRQFGRRPGL